MIKGRNLTLDLKTTAWGGVKSYSLINSPIIAPLNAAVTQLQELQTDSVSKELFREFVIEHGPFDIIHFQTLEGLSPYVLELKSDFPNIRFVYSVHDYGLVCPNVRLWTDDKRNCYENFERHDCKKCMKNKAVGPLSNIKLRRPSVVGKIYVIPKLMNRIYFKLSSTVRGLIGMPYWFDDDCVVQYRDINIRLINKYVDAVLCVSNRVSEIIEYFGVERRILHTNYIGTKVAENANYSLSTSSDSEVLTLLYMGYAVEEKGFFFLLEALEQMPKEECSKIALKFASKIDDNSIIERIYQLKSKFNAVTLYNGYSHTDFPQIMKDVNLGIVPPLWEDNLPQVAIEMIANGVPVLTSNNGGAHELNRYQEFVFNTKEELHDKLTKILHNRQLLNDYWQFSNQLTTMASHIDSMLNLYQCVMNNS